MKKYYTVARIKETLKSTESLGVNTHIGRADNYVMRYLFEYWGEGDDTMDSPNLSRARKY